MSSFLDYRPIQEVLEIAMRSGVYVQVMRNLCRRWSQTLLTMLAVAGVQSALGLREDPNFHELQ